MPDDTEGTGLEPRNAQELLDDAALAIMERPELLFPDFERHIGKPLNRAFLIQGDDTIGLL